MAVFSSTDGPRAFARRWPRRRLLGALGLAGLAGAALRRTLAVEAAGDLARVTSEMIDGAEWIPGVDFTESERELMLEDVSSSLRDYQQLRAVPLANDVPPAFRFEVLGSGSPAAVSQRPVPEAGPASSPRPASDDDLAFLSVRELSGLLRSRRISSVELTRLYLDRLRRRDPELSCVVTFTEGLALRQAERADRELAAGRWRGPLHGVPWGAKDLLAVPGYPTTWGAEPYRHQVLDLTSTVVSRLEQAGAVLVAKLSVGELAWGDVWYGGTTKNPWNLGQGSSGSSAGSAAATAAGLVGFALGTETWGSIVSPCTRCGVTGLRPTFGRISRHGAMALSWTLDKIGPIARSAEDCALVFQAIQGPDGMDPTVVDRGFRWPAERDARRLRVGYVRSQFEEDPSGEEESEDQKVKLREWREFDRRALDTLREIGVALVPVELPAGLPVDALALILSAEAGAAFDELTRTNRDDLLVRQIADAWPNVLRQAQLIPAVEYIRANRVRTLLMREMERLFAQIDAYVSPTYGGSNLLLTNLTGHPQVVVPNGFHAADGTPTSITFTGRLFGEAELVTLAAAYQRATDFHLRRPP
jgi:Asp-tRNA(Asn)/Glu-tRNA(Gln) amidotransferase A subunit family amidase